MPFYCLQSLCSRHCFRSTGQPPGSDPGHHSLYQLGGVERCGLFKGRIIHLGTVIRLVGNGTDDDKGNTVQVSTVGNGSPLHLGTVPLKFFDQSVLDFFAGNELISADYTPGMNVNVRIDLLTGAGSNLDKMLICKEFPASQLLIQPTGSALLRFFFLLWEMSETEKLLSKIIYIRCPSMVFAKNLNLK